MNISNRSPVRVTAPSTPAARASVAVKPAAVSAGDRFDAAPRGILIGLNKPNLTGILIGLNKPSGKIIGEEG